MGIKEYIMVEKPVYKTPKEVCEILGIKRWRLKYFRRIGALKRVKWFPGGTKPLYDLNEVRELLK